MRKPGPRISLMATLLSAAIAPATTAQQPTGWQSAEGANRYGGGAAGVAPASTPAPLQGNLPPVSDPTPTRAHVTKGAGTLPREHGQVWREYDIRPYTLRAAQVAKPEQAIVDWILRETGYEAWHTEPLGILSANRDTLRVYHTPEMQSMVADIVDRFVNRQSESEAFSLRVATVGNPNWRAKALPLMAAIPVQSPGRARLDHAERKRRDPARRPDSPRRLP